jgi:hypothetical protein
VANTMVAVANTMVAVANTMVAVANTMAANIMGTVMGMGTIMVMDIGMVMGMVMAGVGGMVAIGAMASAHAGDGPPLAIFGFAVTEQWSKKGVGFVRPPSVQDRARAKKCEPYLARRR